MADYTDLQATHLWCPVKDRYTSVADLGCQYKMM